VSPADYAAWRDRRRAALRELAAPDRVELVGEMSAARRAVLQSYLHEHPGETLDRATLERDIERLYARGEFDTVDYVLERGEEVDTLRVSVREKEWGSGNLRFGLRLEDDFDGSSNFDLGARLRATEVNPSGAEYIVDAQIGKTTRLGYEWLQPLDEGRQRWLRPYAAYSARNQPLFEEQQRALVLRRQTLELGIDAGRWLDDWGALSVGAFRRASRYENRTAVVDIPTEHQNSAGLRLDYLRDTQDDAQFPRHGSYVTGSLRRLLPVLGGEYASSIGELRALRAIPIAADDRLLLQARLQYVDGDAPPADEYGFLGGFLELSGLPEDARAGRHLALGQVIYYRSLMTVFDRYRLFAGGSLESGNAWEDTREVSLDSLLWGGSVFVAAESPLGALYLGYGRTEAGEDSLYLFVGRPY
jgi:NTE family protein